MAHRVSTSGGLEYGPRDGPWIDIVPMPPRRLDQADAIEAASSGVSYVLTTGTGSGKSLAYIIPIVTVLANMPLGIPDEQLAGAGPTGGQLYRYAGLRLIARFEDHVFVFRLSEADPDTGAVQVYSIPLDNVVSMQIREWYWSTPIAVPAVTPAPQPSATP